MRRKPPTKVRRAKGVADDRSTPKAAPRRNRRAVQAPPAKKPRKRRKKNATKVWGESIETDDFVAVPRALVWLGRHDPELCKKVEARHLWLLMALAARKYRKQPIRVYWQSLATDLGVPTSSVRRWGYELRDAGLLRIRNRRKAGELVSAADPSVLRNDRNEFDFELLEEALQPALRSRERARAEAKRRRGRRGEDPEAIGDELPKAAEEETDGVAR